MHKYKPDWGGEGVRGLHVQARRVAVVEDLRVPESVRRRAVEAFFALEPRKERFREAPAVVEVRLRGLARLAPQVGLREGPEAAVGGAPARARRRVRAGPPRARARAGEPGVVAVSAQVDLAHEGVGGGGGRGRRLGVVEVGCGVKTGCWMRGKDWALGVGVKTGCGLK